MGDTDKPSRSERVITLTNIYDQCRVSGDLVAVGDGEKKKREKTSPIIHPRPVFILGPPKTNHSIVGLPSSRLHIDFSAL